MNVLATGGAGYVGVVLVDALLQRGHRVTLFDNFMFGYESVLHLLPNSRLTIIQGDIRQDDRSYLDHQDVIFHLAALSGYPACEVNPHSAQTINVDATQKIVDYLSKNQLIIYASTTSLYGKSKEVCDENTPIKPEELSLYGNAAKLKTKINNESSENPVAVRVHSTTICLS